jgi:adenylate kinase
MTRARRIIALAGLSGSGKTTLLQRVQTQLDFAHLSASQLLRERSERAGRAKDSEALRLGDIDANQRELVEAFVERAADIEGDIVFDCHTVIDTPAGLQFIPSSVFGAMGITDMVFLSVEPALLVERRLRDAGRPRPTRSADELADHQVRAIAAAEDIARAIGASFNDIGAAAVERLSALLGSNLDAEDAPA